MTTPKIMYVCNHPIPLPTEITHGGQLRLYSLATAISQEPNHIIISAFVRTRFVVMKFPVLRFMILALDVLLRGSDVIVLSYPNFPFFPTEFSQWFGPLSTSFLFLLRICKHLRRVRMIIDADDLISAEIITYTRPSERRGRINGGHVLAFEKNLFSLADVIWVVSANEAESIRSTHRPNVKFFVVPNGNVRSDHVPEFVTKDKVRFVYAGTLSRDKQEIVHLLKVFNSLDAPDIELYVIGPGGAWIPHDLLGPKVRYLGALTHRDAERYVKACDVGLILYTSKERFFEITFPVKLALYITNELPVVCLDSSAIAKFVRENEIGLTTTPDFLSEEIVRIAHSDTLRKKFAANCRKISNEYYFDTIFEKAIRTSLKKNVQEKEANSDSLPGQIS